MKHIILPLAAVIALLLLAGCAEEKKTELVPIEKETQCNKPYILHAGSCCLDLNANNVCDSLEATTTSTSTMPKNPETSTTTPEETCSDGIMNNDEEGVDCGGPCRPCMTECDLYIKNSSAVKPATRTEKLCLSSKAPTTFGRFNLTARESGGTSWIIATDPDLGTMSKYITPSEDIYIENVALRLIGAAQAGGVHYMEVYAWEIDNTVTCTLNSDCGEEKLVGYGCIDGKTIISQHVYYRCLQPGTIFSECRMVQKQEIEEVCSENKRCVQGEDRCFPKECFDGIQNKDEDGTDCGGACRPCHCFNAEKDAGEKGVDCDGGCRPCINVKNDDTKPPAIMLESPAKTTYTKQIIDLGYRVNEEVDWCGYSINGRANVTVEGNRSIYARKGLNELVLYCNDTAGNMNRTTQEFTVYLIEDRTCPEDGVKEAYSEYFDEAWAYLASEKQLGVPEKCSMKVYGYALTYLNDSETHASSTDATEYLKDGSLENRGLTLAYDCTSSGKLKAGYLKLVKNIDVKKLSRLKTIVYFRANEPFGDSGPFWRIYGYTPEGNAADPDSYVDIPYIPLGSNCGNNEVLYQELDLTPLLVKLASGNLNLRLGFYTSRINAEITVTEAELYMEEEQRGR
ncbi:MAG: hypothetical protein JW724_01915 [Candidatus Altiarchaeota archaeon]|nr:hypothetical protein [Candidatus Altiarchaeota archaeon]